MLTKQELELIQTMNKSLEKLTETVRTNIHTMKIMQDNYDNLKKEVDALKTEVATQGRMILSSSRVIN